ncbi:MAG: hypothetical protein KatS3mg009_2269 [Acidimicrobiia bacterium]|nr:MAG: hypothetical protein KatS3mg009_2269 [Acidimicrobiia bacterium]
MLDYVLRRLTNLGARRGSAGSNVWLAVAVVAVGARAIRRISHPASDVLYRTRIRPGDRFEITAR